MILTVVFGWSLICIWTSPTGVPETDPLDGSGLGGPNTTSPHGPISFSYISIPSLVSPGSSAFRVGPEPTLAPIPNVPAVPWGRGPVVVERVFSESASTIRILPGAVIAPPPKSIVVE